MPIFDDPSALFEEAQSLYQQGDNPIAALLWRRAREAALDQGNYSLAFNAGVREADAWRMHGDFKRALELFMLLLGTLHHDVLPSSHWAAQMNYFLIQSFLMPQWERLDRHITDLEALSSRQPHPASDLELARGNVVFLKGEWARSTYHFSLGWQKHKEEMGGFAKHTFARFSILSCLRLKQREDAQDWWRHLSHTDQETWAGARSWLKSASFHLALYDGKIEAVRYALANSCGTNNLELRAHLLMRGSSLDPIHNPSEFSHPARKCAFTVRSQDVHKRYDNLLALVDYRLACLRFTAGLPAVDDLYYQSPDVVPAYIKLTDLQCFQKQLRSFNFSWGLLRHHAYWLDDLMQCDWRTKEISSRHQRYDAIVRACQSLLPDS